MILRLIYFISPNNFIRVLTTAYQWTLFQYLTHDTHPISSTSGSNVVVEGVGFLSGIRESPTSNLGSEDGYFHSGFRRYT